MVIEFFITLLLLLLASHWIADYPLQGDFLANAKKDGPLRFYHLVAHSGIHGAFVMIVTGSWILGLTEWFLHIIIDEMKIRGYTNFVHDQFLHICCKILYVAIITLGFI
jgi:hypothetical protein